MRHPLAFTIETVSTNVSSGATVVDVGVFSLFIRIRILYVCLTAFSPFSSDENTTCSQYIIRHDGSSWLLLDVVDRRRVGKIQRHDQNGY